MEDLLPVVCQVTGEKVHPDPSPVSPCTVGAMTIDKVCGSKVGIEVFSGCQTVCIKVLGSWMEVCVELD